MTTVALDAVYPSSAGFWSGSQVTTGSWTHTCTGTNLLLIVDVAIGAHPDGGLGVNASYGGKSMTLVSPPGIIHPGGDNAGFQARFLLLNASVGRNSVTVNVTGGKATIAGASISFNGADQSTGIAATTYSASGTSSTPTVAVTSNTNGNIIMSSAVAGRAFQGPGANGTKLFTRNGTTAYDGGMIQGASWAATGSSVTTSFSINGSDDWSIISNEILSATGTVMLPVANLQLTAGSFGNIAKVPQWFNFFSRAPNNYFAGAPPLLPIQVSVSNTTGQWMFAVIAWRQDGGVPGLLDFPSTVSVSDDAGNFWIPVESGQPSTGIVRCAIWMAPAARAATTVTFSPASTQASDALQAALWGLVFAIQGNCPWYTIEETDFAYVNQGTSLTVSQDNSTTGLFTVGVVASDNNAMPVTVSSGLGWASLTTFPIFNLFDDTGDLQVYPFYATTAGSPLSLSIARSSGNNVADLAGVLITVHGVTDTLPYPYPAPLENWPVLITEIASGPVINQNPVMLSGTTDWSVGGGQPQTTVTATASGGNTFNGMALTVLVLTGAAAVQNGATASSDAGGVPDLAITPNATGSLVYGAVVDAQSVSPYTPLASSTFTQNLVDATNDATYGTFRSTATTTAATPVTLGASAPSAAHTAIALAEILAASPGSLAENASAPPVANTTSAVTVTTATFTPPPGSLLVAVVSSNFNAFSAITMTVTGGGLSWTQASADGNSMTSVWIAQVPAASTFATLSPAAWPVFQPYPNYQNLLTPSIAITPSGLNATVQLISEPELINAALNYSTNAWVYCPGNSGQFLTLQPQVVWYDATAVNILETDSGTSVNPGPGSWVNLIFPAGVSPPGNAVYAAAAILITSTQTFIASSNVIYVGYCGVGASDAYENVPPDELSWSDVSSRNFTQDTIQISRGIQYEQQALEAGTMTVTLVNSDGAMMFGNLLSTYWPNIGDTDVPIRLRAIDLQSQTPYSVLFSGFTDEIKFAWDEGTWFGYAEIEASDAWSRLTTQMLEPYVEEVQEDNPVVFTTLSNSGANSALSNTTPMAEIVSNFGAGSAVATFAGNSISLPGAASLSNWQVTGVGTASTGTASLAAANQGIALGYFPPGNTPLPPVTGGVTTTFWLSTQNAGAGGTLVASVNPQTDLVVCTAWSGGGPTWSIFIDNGTGNVINTQPQLVVYDQVTGAGTVTNLGGNALFLFGNNDTVNTYFAVSFTQTSLTIFGYTVGAGGTFVKTVPCNLAPSLIGFSLGGNAGPLYATAGTVSTVGFWNSAFADFAVFQGLLPPARIDAHEATALAVSRSGLTEAQGELDVSRLARVLGYAGATPVVLAAPGWNEENTTVDVIPSGFPGADQDVVTPLTDTNGQVTSSYFTNIASSTLAFMFVNGPGTLIYRRRLQQYNRSLPSGLWALGDNPGLNLLPVPIGAPSSGWVAINSGTLVPGSLPQVSPLFSVAGVLTGDGVHSGPLAKYGDFIHSVLRATTGDTYGFSALVYSPQGWPTGAILIMQFIDQFVHVAYAADSVVTPVAAGSLTYLSIPPLRAPNGTVFVSLYIGLQGTPPSSVQLYITDVQFTQVPPATAGGGQPAPNGANPTSPPGIAQEVPYLVGAALSSDRALLFNQTILNQFGTNTNTTFTGSSIVFQPTSGVVVTIQNTPSVIARAGVPYTATLYLNNTAQQFPYYLNDPSMEDFGNWIVNTLSAPLLRPDSVTITPSSTPQAFPMALVAEIADTVTFRRRPVGAAEIQIVTYISKLTHSIDIGAGQWNTQYELSPYQAGVVLECDDVIHGPPSGGNLLGF